MTEPPAPLPVPDYVALVRAAAAALVREATAAGVDAPVPTCPRWRVADLLAHVGIVHRWATSHLRGDEGRTPDGGATPSRTAVLRQVPREDLAGWVAAGADDLVAALLAAPDDLRAMTFLREAPAPRVFWARRQTHETTVHAVDALGARLARVPTTDEAVAALGLTTATAVDGLDELLRGFITRGAARIRTDRPYTAAVAPADAGTRWLLHVDEAVVTTVVLSPDGADAVLAGPAAALYLGLWNRGDEIDAGGLDVLTTWRAKQRVRWS